MKVSFEFEAPVIESPVSKINTLPNVFDPIMVQ